MYWSTSLIGWILYNVNVSTYNPDVSVVNLFFVYVMFVSREQKGKRHLYLFREVVSCTEMYPRTALH